MQYNQLSNQTKVMCWGSYQAPFAGMIRCLDRYSNAVRGAAVLTPGCCAYSGRANLTMRILRRSRSFWLSVLMASGSRLRLS